MLHPIMLLEWIVSPLIYHLKLIQFNIIPSYYRKDKPFRIYIVWILTNSLNLLMSAQRDCYLSHKNIYILPHI
jgi:hypothetical protein